MNVNIRINPAYFPYLHDTRRTQIFYGGSSSGKSYFLAQRIILDLLQGERNYLIIRNVMATIRLSVFNELKKAISRMGVDDYFKVNESTYTITCLDNERQAICYGCDNIEKIKSVTAQRGVITDIFIEEATEVSYESYKQLRKRLRGHSSVNKRITLAFNPIVQSHWIYKEFFKQWSDEQNKYETDDMLILKTTYKDNLFLADEDIKELENETDAYFYNVYTLGYYNGSIKTYLNRGYPNVKTRAILC